MVATTVLRLARGGGEGSDLPTDAEGWRGAWVVAVAADRLGRRSGPLVCTNGRPSGAARRLLGGLSACGARLFLHADDDAASRYEEQELDELLADPAQG